MEYEMDDFDFCGNVPEFGAIFMANTETKKKCFKQRIFGLPSSQANFVKQVKAGMVLFLFEYEKRQLFGVYQATSDGTINHTQHAFSSLGRQFPAQVHFAPLWICSPLSESEFKGAISENYFSRMKFKFGLSEDQVQRLLQLFSTRIQSSLLSSRQLLKEVPTSSNKVRRQVSRDRSSANERSEMEYGLEDFSPSGGQLFIDDALDDEGERAIIGQGSTPHYTDTSIHRNRRLNYKRSGPDLYQRFDHLLDSGTDGLDLYNGQMPRRSANFFRSDNADNDFDGSSPDPATGPKFSRDPMDCTKRAEWTYLDGKGWPPYEDRSCVAEGMQKSEPDLGFLFANRRDNVNMHDVLYEGDLLRMRGNENDKVLMSDKSLGPSFEDNYVSLGLTSHNFGTPLNGEQRRTGEQRLSSMDNFMKDDYIDYRNRLSTLNASSALETGIENHVDDYSFHRRTVVNELDMGNITRADISNKYSDLGRPYRCSPECLNMSCSDVKFSDSNLSLSTAYDGIVRRSVSEAQSVRHGRSLPMMVGHSASSVRDINSYPSECNYQALSRSKTFEADGSSRVYASEVGNNIPGRVFPKYVDCPTTGISDSVSVKSAAAAEYRSTQFSPDFVYGSLNNEIPIGSHHHYGVSPAVQKYISSQTPKEVVNYRGLQSPTENLTDSDMRYQEYNPVNHDLEGYDMSNPCMENKEQGFRSREVVRTDHTDSGDRRKSVFSRLTSTSRIRVQNEEEKDIDMNIESSVDEVMEILRRSQKSNLKKQKRIKPQVQRLDGREMKKKVTLVSSVKPRGNSDLKLVPEKINDESRKERGGCINETLTETRAVEFGRRGDKKRSISEKIVCTDLKKEDGKSTDNAEPEVPLSKQPKRRKLVRPAFGSSKVEGGSGMDKESLSSPQPTDQ